MNGPFIELRRIFFEPQPETSKEAFGSIDLTAAQNRVLAYIVLSADGRTADDCDAALGCGHQRFSELRRKGLIVKTGEKRTTRSGRKAFVFRAAD
jgi:hypothetical protein